MKKIILVPALLGVMGIGAALAVSGGNLTGSANNQKVLTLDAIENKALAEVNGTIRDIEYAKVGTKNYYEVEVVTADAEYDLKFDAVTGELLKKKKDTVNLDNRVEAIVGNDDNVQQTTKQITQQSNTTTTQNNVTSAPKTVVGNGGDDDNNKQQSTQSARTTQNNTNVTSKSAATTTPQVVTKNDDDDNDDKQQITQSTQSKKITQQQAIQIALGKVNGTVTKVELDDDNKYEIEIVKGQIEYDFEINEATGAIIKMEQDNLDD